MACVLRALAWPYNLLVTLCLWLYFTLGWFVLFGPATLGVRLCFRNRASAMQTLNHYFCRGFFLLARLFAPWLRIRIPEELRRLRSSMIVGNHLSYFDPLLMVAMNRRQTTVFKATFRKVPIFGWLLDQSGYLWAAAESFEDLSQDRFEKLKQHFASGGNFFIFPEGTRSRSGQLGGFKKGAFNLARLCRAPITLVLIRNTCRFFPPGKFLVNVFLREPVSIEPVGRLEPDYDAGSFSVRALAEQARGVILERLKQESGGIVPHDARPSDSRG